MNIINGGVGVVVGVAMGGASRRERSCSGVVG